MPESQPSPKLQQKHHPHPEVEHQAPIPEELRIQLEDFKKKLWRIKTAEAILAGIFGLILSFLIVFLLDRFFETPRTLRFATLVTGASLLAIFAPYWIHRWVYGHRYENQLARLISQKFPHLGDRLLGAVELQDQTAATESLSPQLRAAAMKDVAHDIATRDLNTALPKSRHGKWSLAVISMLIITAVTVLSFPQAGNNALKRWLLPLSDTPRYTFTQLDLSDLEGPQYVPYGESFSLTVPLDKNTIRSPKTARARYGNGDWIESTLANGAYTFEISGQRTADNLHLEADDAFHSLPVQPVIRPSAQSIRASVQLPAYLERPNISADLRSGFITVLEGSHITIKATTSRKLESANAHIVYPPQEETFTTESPQESDPKPSAPKIKNLQLTITNNQISTNPLKIGTQPVILPITWRGTYGLEADKPLRIRVENIQDQSPSTFIQGVQRQHIMLAEETLSLEILADDDYGLKACGIEWVGDPAMADRAQGEISLGRGGPNQTILNEAFSFSPANMEIAPQKVILRSWAEDYNPERGRVYSEPIILHVLTPDEHAQTLKDDFDKIIGKLEDIAREEQNLNDENRRLDQKENKQLLGKEGLQKLQQQQDAEQKNQERMDEITQDMEKLFKDSVRNGQIDKDTLKKMSKSLQSMKQLSESDLPKVQQKLQDAQKQSNSEKKSEEDLKQAIEEQKKAIKKMQQALKDANEANKQFEAGTFVNRLKRAASDENNIASTFIAMINEVIGATADKLDPVEQRALSALHQKQRQTAEDIRWIQEDLTHYFQRTQKEEHKKLAEEMQSSGINESLEKLSTTIEKNISFVSLSTAKQWANQLNSWAKELKGDDASDDGGDGTGSPSQEDQDFEFMLQIMRMIQNEQDLRGRTRALEDLYRTLGKNTSTFTPTLQP